MDLNLDTLKREILEYLETAGMAVFHGEPGGLEGQPLVLWDAEHYPDYRMFLDIAAKVGAKLVVFASAEFESSDIEELAEQLDDCDLTREQRRDFESRIRDLRIYEGVTCTIELAFDVDGRFFVYEVQPDWYEDFLMLEDEITANLTDDDDYNGGDSLGGYFSKN